MYQVRTKGKTETTETKSVKVKRMTAQNTCKYNLGNNKNFV